MTITNLTIRQFLKSRSFAVVAVICLIPILLAIIPHLVNSTVSLRSIQSTLANDIFMNLYATLLIPISVMVLASAAIGDEIEDKTLYILALKPISRFRIVLEKFIAVIVVSAPVLFIALTLVWATISWGKLDLTQEYLVPMFAASLVGLVGFGSIFMMLSLYIRRTLLFGMFYVTIWEGALAGFLPGIRSFSISHYCRSMFVELLDNDRITIDNVASIERIVITVGIIAVVSLTIATYKLRSMAID